MTLQDTFGFRKIPFTREVGADEMLAMPHLDEARQALVARLERRSSVAIIAPAGTGKTCLLRAVRQELPEARYRVHYVKVTELSKRDLCREIATAIGVPPAGTYPMLVRRLQEDFEQTSAADGVRPVLVLDDAHDIRPDVLAILRVLTNFEWDSRLVVSIVLAGQPPLEKLLAKPSCEDVAQRIAFYARLRLLSRDETATYLEHRCTIAGAHTLPFDRAAIDALFEMTRGNLRALDQLALGALDEAAKGRAKTVAASNVAAARKHLWS